MSQSPPAFYAGRDAPDASAADAPGDLRARTLPKELRRDQDNIPHGSPTLSVRSLNLKPASPRLAKARFGSSPSNMCAMEDARDGGSHVQIGRIQYLVAVHRLVYSNMFFFIVESLGLTTIALNGKPVPITNYFFKCFVTDHFFKLYAYLLRV